MFEKSNSGVGNQLSRRRVIGTLAATTALSGCAGFDFTPFSDSDSETKTDTVPRGIFARVSLEGSLQIAISKPPAFRQLQQSLENPLESYLDSTDEIKFRQFSTLGFASPQTTLSEDGAGENGSLTPEADLPDGVSAEQARQNVRGQIFTEKSLREDFLTAEAPNFSSTAGTGLSERLRAGEPVRVSIQHVSDVLTRVESLVQSSAQEFGLSADKMSDALETALSYPLFIKSPDGLIYQFYRRDRPYPFASGFNIYGKSNIRLKKYCHNLNGVFCADSRENEVVSQTLRFDPPRRTGVRSLAVDSHVINPHLALLSASASMRATVFFELQELIGEETKSFEEIKSNVIADRNRMIEIGLSIIGPVSSDPVEAIENSVYKKAAVTGALRTGEVVGRSLSGAFDLLAVASAAKKAAQFEPQTEANMSKQANYQRWDHLLDTPRSVSASTRDDESVYYGTVGDAVTLSSYQAMRATQALATSPSVQVFDNYRTLLEYQSEWFANMASNLPGRNGVEIELADSFRQMEAQVEIEKQILEDAREFYESRGVFGQSDTLQRERENRRTGVIDDFERPDALENYRNTSNKDWSIASNHVDSGEQNLFTDDRAYYDLVSMPGDGLERYPQAGDTFTGTIGVNGDNANVYFGVAEVTEPTDTGLSARGYTARVSPYRNTISLRLKRPNGENEELASRQAAIQWGQTYRLTIDWRTDGTITLNVKPVSEDRAVAVSTTDDRHTEGGFGFRIGNYRAQVQGWADNWRIE